MALTALLVASTMLSQDTYALLWKPKEGEKTVYEFYLDYSDSSIGGSVEASIEYVVSDVSANGSYLIVSRSLGAILRLQGQEIKDDRLNESTAKFGYSGDLIEIQKGTRDVERYRQALLTRFVAPPASVKLTESWSYERKKDRPKGLGACKVDFRLVSVSNGQAHVSFTFTESGVESPMTAKGDWWIDTATGQPVLMSAKVENYLGKKGAEANVRIIRRETARTAKARS